MIPRNLAKYILPDPPTSALTSALAAVLATTLITMPAMAASTGGSSTRSFELSGIAQGGFDDHIQTGTDITDTLETRPGVFGSSQLKGAFRVDGPSRRFLLFLAGALTGYPPQVGGQDRDLRGEARYGSKLLGLLPLDLDLLGLRYRRDAAPVGDLDLISPEMRIGWSPAASSLLSLDLRTTWTRFLHRFLTDETGTELIPRSIERDRRDDLALCFITASRSAFHLVLELGWRRNRSNQSWAEYDGPTGELRLGAGSPTRLATSGYLSYSGRSYRTEPTFVPFPGAPGPASLRRDFTWLLGMDLERRIVEGVSAFGGGLFARQLSNLSSAQYHEFRWSLGIEVALLSRKSGARSFVLDPAPGAGPMAPDVTPSGVRFRCVAEGARRVAVVGSFNSWDPDRDLLTGPDADGRWQGTVALPQVIWRYAFVVDGRWLRPEDAPKYEADGFGGENGLLIVPDGR